MKERERSQYIALLHLLIVEEPCDFFLLERNMWFPKKNSTGCTFCLPLGDVSKAAQKMYWLFGSEEKNKKKYFCIIKIKCKKM